MLIIKCDSIRWYMKKIGCLVSVSFFLCFMVESGFGFHEELMETFSKEDFEKANLNKDGFVDEEEFLDYVKKNKENFAGPDNDKTQVIDREKLEEPQTEQFIELGKDKDKRTSFKTFMDRRIRFFRELDENNDRRLSFDEIRDRRVGIP